MIRALLGVVVGVVVLGATVTLVQSLAEGLHPLPEGMTATDLTADPEALERHVSTMPATVWAIGVASELLGAFLGALAAGWIAREKARPASAAIVGLALLGSVYNWTNFSHPAWYIAVQLVGYPLVLVAVWAALERSSERAPAV